MNNGQHMKLFEDVGLYNLKHISKKRKHERKMDRKSRKKRLSKLEFVFDNVYHSPTKNSHGLYSIVYIIQHVVSGCFYIGVHTDTNPNSILTTYFTSSNVIASIIAVDGKSSFVVKKLFFLPNRRVAEELESYLIRLNEPSKNIHILNKAFKFEGKTTVAEWGLQPYGEERIAINPKCKILTESNSSDVSWYTLPIELKSPITNKPSINNIPKKRLLSIHGPDVKVHRVSSADFDHLK